jgi:hypothetical protein
MLRNAFSVVAEPGAVGPTTHKLIQDLLQLLSNLTGTDVTLSTWPLTAGITLLVIWLSAIAYFILKQRSPELQAKQVLFLVCLVYALIHPRFKDYAYLLLVVPSYYIIKNAWHLRVFPLLFILAILASPQWPLPLLGTLSVVLWKYYPLIFAFGVWGIYLHEIFAAPEPVKGVGFG